MTSIIIENNQRNLPSPPQTYPNETFQSIVVEIMRVNELITDIIRADVFTDGTAIWANGEMIGMNRISGLALPIDPTDAASKAYVDSAVGGNPGGPGDSVQFNNGGTFGGTSDFSWNNGTNTLTVNGTVTGLSAPVNNSDAANKAYVDAASGTPAAPVNSIQFNNSGAFGGTSDLTWDGTILDITGDISATNYFGTNVSVTNIAGNSLTDGIITISGGSITGISNITATSATINSISDGSGTTIEGGIVTATTITDNIATLSGGVLSDVSLVTGLDPPVNPADAANKAYVDAATGTSPGLPFNSVQFNSAGIFGGDANFTWDGSTLTVNGSITDGTATLSSGSYTGLQDVEASGQITFTGSTASTSTTSGTLIVTGGVGIGGAVNIGGDCFANEFNAVSDMNLKENIKPLENSLDLLNKIGCFSYNLIGSHCKSYGVLAQQLEEVGFEDFVKESSSHKAVNYLPFIALLIDGIKELKKEVTELKHFKTKYISSDLTNNCSYTKKTVECKPVIKSSLRLKRSRGNIKPTDRKTHEGRTYKFCTECSDWTFLENFKTDSKYEDNLRPFCKKH